MSKVFKDESKTLNTKKPKDASKWLKTVVSFVIPLGRTYNC